MEKQEFYIGWQAKAPPGFATHVKKIVLIIVAIVISVGIVLSISQKKFSTGNFEFGKLTQVKGIFTHQPVPSIVVESNKDIIGNSTYITIPLLGFGKFGAEGIIDEIQKTNGTSLQNKEVVLKGTLLYNDGKLLMQIDRNDTPLVSVKDKKDIGIVPQAITLGQMTIKGEVVDPKCFFGVMKPGQGKPHKDCATRCILGGIPPVLKVEDEKGNNNYYLLVGPNGEKISQLVKDFVAQPVELDVEAVSYGDWIVLYLKNKENIKMISRRNLIFPNAVDMICAVH